MQKPDELTNKLQYQAECFEMLINRVDKNKGFTVIPLLATTLLKPPQREKL